MAGGLRFEDITGFPETVQEQVVSQILAKVSQNIPVAGTQKVKVRKLRFPEKKDMAKYVRLKTEFYKGNIRNLRALTEKGWVWGFSYQKVLSDGTTQPKVEELYPMI